VRLIVIDNLVSIFKQIRFGCFFIFIFADFFRVSAREISFFTFNAGLMKIYGHDLVPCVDERESEQPKLVFDQLNSAKSKHSAVIAVFQEVGTLGGFEKYSEQANLHGYHIYPEKYERLKSNGLLTVSSHPLLTSRLFEFEHDVSNRGIIEHLVEINGVRIRILNTHTEYSGIEAMSRNHFHQLAKINDFLRARQLHGLTILGGDFNTGPELAQNITFHSKLWREALLRSLGHIKQLKLENQGFSWDYEKNTLINQPARIIRLIYSEQQGWENYSANLDHIFASNAFSEVSTELVFNNPVRNLKCDGRELVYPSDHFGLNTVLRF